MVNIPVIFKFVTQVVLSLFGGNNFENTPVFLESFGRLVGYDKPYVLPENKIIPPEEVKSVAEELKVWVRHLEKLDCSNWGTKDSQSITPATAAALTDPFMHYIKETVKSMYGSDQTSQEPRDNINSFYYWTKSNISDVPESKNSPNSSLSDKQRLIYYPLLSATTMLNPQSLAHFILAIRNQMEERVTFEEHTYPDFPEADITRKQIFDNAIMRIVLSAYVVDKDVKMAYNFILSCLSIAEKEEENRHELIMLVLGWYNVINRLELDMKNYRAIKDDPQVEVLKEEFGNRFYTWHGPNSGFVYKRNPLNQMMEFERLFSMDYSDEKQMLKLAGPKTGENIITMLAEALTQYPEDLISVTPSSRMGVELFEENDDPSERMTTSD
ncbi:hypothetical protein IWQ62_002988 [Dispira parvispora]|uniref:Uncharacterized protein n=1 Tax=Dispira parvispora TaxID=1520584 RepID=A0A9W8E3B4_9FUNG|nr:hypothetical protein IWQ62_002988 [Dispira parvispora]